MKLDSVRNFCQPDPTFAGGPVSRQNPAYSEAIGSNIRLFVIGDSISIQYGPYLQRYLGSSFLYDRKRDTGTESARRNLDNPEGANGGDSKMVLQYLQARRASSLPIRADILLFNCGLHDIKTDPTTGKKQVDPLSYAANLRGIIGEIASVCSQPVWLRTTPVIDEIHNTRSTSILRHAQDVSQYNGIADSIMNEAGIPTIDLHAFSEKLIPEYFCDHVHYTENARALQGAFIAGVLTAFVTNTGT